MEWKKLSEMEYALCSGGDQLGKLVKNKPGHSTFTADRESYQLHRTGTWRSHTVITDMQGEKVLELKPEKWYANKYIFTYNGSTYLLGYRNNPLYEIVVTCEGKELLAYGLAHDNTANRLSIRIMEHSSQPIVLHALLWHLFEPVARENFGDNAAWLLLMIA